MGMGDFNNDGVGIDLVYRDTLGTGSNLSVYTWDSATGRYNNETIVNMSVLLAFGQGGRMIGVGKVTSTSGSDEVVFQDVNGIVFIGAFVSTAGVINPAGAGTQIRSQSSDWIGQGLADLNGDGRDDIVWRSASTGAISYWSTDVTNPRIVTISPINTTPVTLEWDLVGMGDLDADGDDDLIWRRNTDGFTATWLMAGGSIGSVQGIATLGWDWRLEGTGDLNGDGRTDLIWRNASGQYAAYLMNGAAISSTILSGTVEFNRLTMGWNQAFMRSL
jgi:FG-GAP repeat